MTEPPISPDMNEAPKPIPLTKRQLWEIWFRIEKVDAHFKACCAFQMDRCHYGEDFDDLYHQLHLAGVEERKTPFDREDFEQWINTYEEPA